MALFAGANLHDGTRVVSSFAGSGVGVLQFAAHEVIELNIAGGDALRFGANEGGIGNVVRGGNELFEQRAQFRRMQLIAL